MPFRNDSDPEVISKSAAVADVFTPELRDYLLSLLPTSEVYSELHNNFEASYAASLKGAPENLKACEANRAAVTQNLTILQGLAKLLSVKDPSVPEKLGFGQLTLKTAVAATALGYPHDFKVTFSPEGRPLGSVTRVPGAKGYQVWACEGDPGVEENWRLAASSSHCRGVEIPGLNRGKINWLKIRSIRGKLCGPWSNLVCLNPN